MNQTDKNETYQKDLIKPVVFWGRITNLLACLLSFLPAIYLWVFYDAVPPLSAVIAASSAVILGFSGVLWIVEPISYFPIMGIPGTYMSFLSGNISNLRVPCSTMAQEAAGVEEGSDEGGVIATLGVGISIIINLAVMVVGVIVGGQIVAAFPPVVHTAFESYILPAVYGGVFAQFALKNWKAAAIAFLLASVLSLTSFPTYVVLPLCIFLTIFAGIFLNNRQKGKTINGSDDGAL